MIKVGLTGGIGSGKSTVAKVLEVLGVPVYNSDQRAKHLMTHNPQLKQQIEDLFGVASYQEGVLNRSYLAKIVFSDSIKLKQLNEIVHPKVRTDFEQWVKRFSQTYVVNESAILFESGLWNQMDLIICVIADKDVKIQRVMDRDGLTEQQVMERMSNQASDETWLKYSDFVVKNTNEMIISQVQIINDKIWEISQNGSEEV